MDHNLSEGERTNEVTQEMQRKMDEQFARLSKVEQSAREEERILDQVSEERTRTISRVAGDAWKQRAFHNYSKSQLDPLLSKKFKTKAGLSTIRLEKLLLELDKVESFGVEEIRASRKNLVNYLQSLLKTADALNDKANRLVLFQERLANIGRDALRSSFEAAERKHSSTAQNRSPSDSTRGTNKRIFTDDDEESGDRKEEKLAGPTKLSPSPSPEMDVEANDGNPSPRPSPSSDEQSEDQDSMDEVRAAEEELNRKAEEFYKHARTVTESKQKVSQVEGKQSKPQSLSIKEDLSEPTVDIQEYPRAYVMTVTDANARKARVSLGQDDVLTILVPGRAPVHFTLGANIKKNAVTKETQGHHQLRLILPKADVFPMRTGRGSGEMSMPWGRRSHNDFWSRF